MVGPANLKPFFFISLLMAIDSFVTDGIRDCSVHEFLTRFPPVNFHTYVSKLPNSLLTARNDFAFGIADSIFSLFRIIPSSARSNPILPES
jgi:hypothetical protein